MDAPSDQPHPRRYNTPSSSTLPLRLHVRTDSTFLYFSANPCRIVRHLLLAVGGSLRLRGVIASLRSCHSPSSRRTCRRRSSCPYSCRTVRDVSRSAREDVDDAGRGHRADRGAAGRPHRHCRGDGKGAKAQQQRAETQQERTRLRSSWLRWSERLQVAANAPASRSDCSRSIGRAWGRAAS